LNGLTPETLRRTALDCFDDYAFYGVSVFAALDQTVGDLCRSIEDLRRYGAIRESTVGALRRAGFALVATGASPHFDIVLPDLEDSTLSRLEHGFGRARENPGRRK
jgi:hypothetical protein